VCVVYLVHLDGYLALFRVWGLGFRVVYLVHLDGFLALFRVKGLGFGVWVSGFKGLGPVMF
jgi:hypothetical protein